MIILGLDPGTATTGYGIIKTNVPKHLRQNKSEKPLVLDFGCITTYPSQSVGERLQIIYQEINSLIKKHKPDLIAIESLFFFKNVKTALPVSQARGVIILAAAHHKVPLCELTPLQVKMGIVGYGRASKKQIQEMTKRLLDVTQFSLKEKGRKKDDAADALAIALCAMLL